MATLYRKIAFIHKQCLLFAGSREREFVERDMDTPYLETNRQMYIVNWTSRKDHRNVQLLAIATADVETEYVFGIHFNFNGTVALEFVATNMVRYGDDRLPQPFRRYARISLPQNYER